MPKSQSNGNIENLKPDETVEVECWNCGNLVTMSLLKAESMNQMEQVILCEKCDEEEGETRVGLYFVPFF